MPTVDRQHIVVTGADAILDALVAAGDGGISDGPVAARVLEQLGSTVDWRSIRAAVVASERAIVIGEHPDGPVLAAKWFAPGLPTTIHDHGCPGAALLVEGACRYECFARVGSTTARLKSIQERRAGEVSWWEAPPNDVHRQTALGDGALELVLLTGAPTEPVDLTDVSLHGIGGRRPVAAHDGRSGARIETGHLADGTSVYVKTAPMATDVAAVLTGSATRELDLFASGAFERLPPGVATALVTVEVVGDELVTVSRDLGDAMLRWDRTLTAAELGLVLDGMTAVHKAFADDPPAGLCDLDTRVNLLAPQRLDAVAAANPGLAAAIARGWELFADLVPADVAAAVASVHRDPRPLAAAMATGGTTLLHGDCWLVNLAIQGGVLVLLDWNIATLGPPCVDLLTFCVGATSNVDVGRDELLAAARSACAWSVDDLSFAAAELWALVELGWNKAVDAVEHPDPAKRATEWADLDFWVRRARAALDRGVLV